MKGWLYVISNRAVSGLVKVGSTPNDPVVYAESLERSSLPYPYTVGYEALVPDMAEAERLVTTALASKAEGKGWFKCSTAEAVREIVTAVGNAVIMENRYDGEAAADRWRIEISSTDPSRRANALSDPGCPLNILKFAIDREADESVLLVLIGNPAVEVLEAEQAELVGRCSGYDRLIAAMAVNPNTPQDALLSILGTDPEEPVLFELIGNPSFPDEGFDDVISEHMENATIMEALATQPNCPAASLARICWLSSSNESLRKAVRRHANWSEKTFLDLLRDESGETPDWVTEHPDCTAEMLRTLSDESLDARAAALANPNCPDDLLVMAVVAGITDTHTLCPELLLVKNGIRHGRRKGTLLRHDVWVGQLVHMKTASPAPVGGKGGIS